ncbi:type VII secretion integral membrane protein EccD [Mycobacterium branderi]|uniref:type VII secretion integral membrane protein EccD n=1 Tax=Mycobacterium branderi TaxID=43348 RepID=UPI0013CFD95C|nr:type VII secretion integral membrane protein EccD [Mycobacterium branderi]MCV7233242.1 type VII secretion integral membrane protein EccD [Mycobacterium branderi]
MQEADLRRVSIHTDEVRVDLALPAAVPIATLIPAIVDILPAGHALGDGPTRYQLSCPGEVPLDASTTLAQQGIRDGAVLILSCSSTDISAPQFDDAAEAVSASLATAARASSGHGPRITGALAGFCLASIGAALLTRQSLCDNGSRQAGAAIAAVAGGIALAAATLTQRGFRDSTIAQALALLAIGFAAVAGLLAVPGGPGAPNALLAATTAGVTAVVVVRLTGCDTPLFTAAAGFALLSAIAALAATVTNVPLPAIGAVCVVVSLALIAVSPLISILLTGLSPRLADDMLPDTLPAKAIRADTWLTGLIGAFSTTAACGAVTVANCAPGVIGVVFAAVTGAVLLAQARSHRDMPKVLTLVTNGTATLSAALVAGAIAFRPPVAWLAAATAMLTAAAFIAPTVRLSPVAQRGFELLERLALAALVPLGCWLCGLYGAARGLTLS